MKRKTAKLLFALMLVSFMILAMYTIVAKGYATDPPPVVWTDKSNYQPGETASIFGAGFSPNGYFDIPVIRPDGTIVLGDGSFTQGWDTVQADGNGNLAYSYILDGISGIYEVRVYNSPWSGSLGETPLASTTFSDANPAANLDQARNGAADSPTTPIDWQNGNLGAQQAHYVEGYSVPYRVVLTDMPTGQSIILTLAYKVKDSDNNALDYLTNFNRINDPSHQDVFGHPPETINPLQTGTGTSLTAADATHISGTTTTFLIPTPPTLNTPVLGQPTGSYNDVIANEGIAAEYMTLYGGNLDNIAYETAADLSLSNVYQFIDVTFHLDGTTAVLAWGGHIASRIDWGFFPDGTPRSAGGIHGSPYHMAIESWTSPDPDTAKALGNLGAQDRSLSAVAVFAPPVPFIALTKTPSATKVETTTLVTYTYNVTNTGGVDFTNVTIVDDTFGTITTGQTLNVNQTKTFTFATTLNHTTTNIATAFGETGTGATVNATATATVTVIHPAISLTKTPSATKVENGTLVTYTYNVTNTGDTSLTGNVTDDTFGLIGTFTLSPGSWQIFNKTVTLTTTTTNTATATGVDQLGTAVTAQASATVTVLHPSITLTKTPSSTKVENGASVTYTYNVTNTGDTSLSGNITDTIFGLIGSFALAPNSWKTFNKTVTLTVTTTNNATAIGVDQLGASVTAQASATVTVITPAISLTKSASSTKIENGSSVTYTYNVTNAGDTSLSGNVTDNVFGFIGSFVLAPGSWKTFNKTVALTTTTTNTATATGVDQLGTVVTAQDSATVTVLHPDLSLTKEVDSTKVENGTLVTYTYNVTNIGDVALTGNITDDVFGTILTFTNLQPGQWVVVVESHVLTITTTNTATAIGVDQLGTSVTAEDSATVTVLHPGISLTKTASSTKVENGTTVWYLYNVTNTGDVALSGNVTDDVFGPVGTFSGLLPGHWVAYSIPHVLAADTTNIATVVGVDQLGTAVTAQDSATVTVLHPAIALTKTPSSTKVENGSSVTYTYNVTNIGDVALSGNLTDDVFGMVDTFTNLQPGHWVAFTRLHVLVTNTTNTATVLAVDQLGATVTAQDTAFVHVIHPSISITKTPNAPKVLTGSNVTYTYNVTNTGDTTLSGNVTDDLLGLIGTFTLLPGKSLTFTASAILTMNTTNTATATGVDQLGAEVSATTGGFVAVIHPAISVVKTCSPEEQFAPGTITWTVVVNNTGDVTLTSINVTDTRHGVLAGGLSLAPSETATFIIVETGLPPGTYYDNATAFGAHQLGTVSDWGDATCTVKPVLILKQFTAVTVLPIGISEGFNATLVNSTDVDIIGLQSGPKIYFTVTYYFENSLNFLGTNFDGQAHNFTLWDKWGGNLMALGSPPVTFNQKTNVVTLADNSTFKIDPTLTGAGSYRGYIGSGLNISDLASQGQAYITMHLGDQQNSTNPGGGKGTNKDGNSYDTDTVWYIGELGVNQSATLTLYIAPGKNPGGKLLFSSPGCTVINTGPRVRAYGDTFSNEDFLYAVERTNTLTVCVSPKPGDK